MKSDKADPSRRHLVGGLSTGVAAALAGPALAQGGGAPAISGGGTPSAPLVDPTTKYPKPPFPKQEQPWPGLASRLEPRPDHGESTYKGSCLL